jgi:hypothetical protein
MGDLKPAPMILARPLPVSTAFSMLIPCPCPGVAGRGDNVPVVERVSEVVMELARRRFLSPDGDLDSIWDMKVDLCVGVPGVSGLGIAVSMVLLRSSVALSVEMFVRSVLFRSGAGRPSRLDSAREVVSSLVALPLPFFEDRQSGWILSNFNV